VPKPEEPIFYDFGVQQVSGLLEIYGKDIERGGQRYPALLSDSTLAQYEVYKKLVWERGWGGGARVLGACYRPLQRAHVMRVRGVSRPQELRVEDHRHRLDVQVAELAARVVLQRLDILRHYQLPVHPRHVVQGFSRPRATRSSPSPLMASLNLFSPARLNFRNFARRPAARNNSKRCAPGLLDFARRPAARNNSKRCAPGLLDFARRPAARNNSKRCAPGLLDFARRPAARNNSKTCKRALSNLMQIGRSVISGVDCLH
jgi:hypothetical protein